MKRRFYIWILVLLLPAPAIAQEDLAINWLSFENLSDSLSQKPKKTLIFFHADWCVYCKKMQREVLTNPKVIAEINKHYYAVQLDVESTEEITFDGQVFANKSKEKRRGQYHELALLLGNRSGDLVLPTTIILDENFFIKERRFEYLHSKKLLTLLRKK
ncbi:thioredoxin family protein [Sphingobacterium corticis]|uniref:Thioredoxin family protein n=1 Tax=Sphingobacterium corticis TaxID=1812823 RepID=A0ABW5NMB4_9SPHI